jgi:hypothetical protein
MLARQSQGVRCERRGSDEHPLIGAVMLKDHPDEGLHLGRPDTMCRGVSLALNGHALAFLVAAPDVDVQVPCAAHPLHFPVAEVVKKIGNGLLEPSRRECQKFSQGVGTEPLSAAEPHEQCDRANDGQEQASTGKNRARTEKLGKSRNRSDNGAEDQ